MSRIPRMIAGLAGLGLLLSACVPLGTETSDPPKPPTTGEASLTPAGSTPSQTADLPLQSSPDDGLEQRIAALDKLSVAYQVQQGRHPVDYAVPGSERVLLAERFSRSTRFELSGEQPGNMIIVEITCSKNTRASVEALDDEGRSLGSGLSSECSPDGPNGYGFGAAEHRPIRVIEVTIDRPAELELSVTVVAAMEPGQATEG
ncbi:hypothetical protein KRR55_11800 [Paeniglutamicibacter sp. ABSL32-1]|uniref:hypothetical protein n=1 Tax=Paeniglutamicibacter quisquiliarum TaxID=2849498 RepID=UPI001C2CC7FF|nr:hypothetical protein [Paeniglutamicibacter quisquiliarum]MBV1779795.1 hypothetical protein [Paeniglutamicibacter quisquiliarum]